MTRQVNDENTAFIGKFPRLINIFSFRILKKEVKFKYAYLTDQSQKSIIHSLD